MIETGSFPRRQALTRRFTLGEPRDIRVSDGGARVAFLRSPGPIDPVNSLVGARRGLPVWSDWWPIPRLLGAGRDG